MIPSESLLDFDSASTIANTYGDYICSGWRNTIDCMHKLGLLPSCIASDTADDVEQISESDTEKFVLLSPPVPTVQASAHSRKSSANIVQSAIMPRYARRSSQPSPAQVDPLLKCLRIVDTRWNMNYVNETIDSNGKRKNSKVHVSTTLIIYYFIWLMKQAVLGNNEVLRN
ncbi:sec7 domain-containing protein [Artemisia annua]|uniref:Sec7 domain-containing protein n=1 Tax=Artemisia annua TaxID=35608 RepID=A0A2U1KZW1_ARTAN|nr:sec7 domain-containing protein [Artemisia annua]